MKNEEIYNAVFDEVVNRIEKALSRRLISYFTFCNDMEFEEDAPAESPWFVQAYMTSGILVLCEFFSGKGGGLPADFDVLKITRETWFDLLERQGATVYADAKVEKGNIIGVVMVGKNGKSTAHILCEVQIGKTTAAALGVEPDTFTPEVLSRMYEVALPVAICKVVTGLVEAQIGKAEETIEALARKANKDILSAMAENDVLKRAASAIKSATVNLEDEVAKREAELNREHETLRDFKANRDSVAKRMKELPGLKDDPIFLRKWENLNRDIDEYEITIKESEKLVAMLKKLATANREVSEKEVKDVLDSVKKFKIRFGITKEW
jgi:hypothetical protein